MYSAALINDPFGDPGVYVECRYRHESLLFDLGDLHRLPPRKLLKVDYIFVSHTHMDHFIGFDHLLRLCLGRNKHLHLFGPPGFLQHLEHKLMAYTWNLVENYTNDFAIIATEVHPGRQHTKRYRCRTAFQPDPLDEHRPFNGVLVETRFFTVSGVFLDHLIPCLAFRFEERRRFNIMKTVLTQMNLPTGAWLMALKEHLLNGDADGTPVRIQYRDKQGNVEEKRLPLGELKQAVKTTSGLRIAYVTDAIHSRENIACILALADQADLLFIEATFLHDDAETAAKKYHLTARQAGALARQAQVKRMVPFHFSPKYKSTPHVLTEEAMTAFRGTDGVVTSGSVAEQLFRYRPLDKP
ncbi:MAG: ribonuclease Z [Deltaproteobacteria bacterium HGW-Deltaproteobacteria-11]|nr:MAG: ribonuclease Z [Deltaproteobacteria bacterium HGW-Deltaproteobacteria-11]